MYSQRNEEKVILDFFNKNLGKYLDIGAFDGVNASNTLALAELGWTGVAVEASLKVFERLQKNYKDRHLLDNIRLINAAVVPDLYPSRVMFYDTVTDAQIGHGTSSLSLEHVKKYQDLYNKEQPTSIIETSIPTLKISDLFLETDFNFISIDVEDLNFELLNAIPWNKLEKLELFCIEADVPIHRVVNFMDALCWKFVSQIGANLFFIRKNGKLS